jgi:uncharacterized protein YsxB (DUF464 family)
MVVITLEKSPSGQWLGLSCSGHAEFSDEEHGGDIVCAAVSALTGYLGVTLSEVLDWPGAVDAADGYFVLRRPEDGSVEAHRVLDVLLEGWVRSVRGLEENYSGWVRIEETHL